MVNTRKTSDELKCLLCAIDEHRTTLPMRDCDQNKTLFSLINVELQLQAVIDSKKFKLAYLFSLVCLSCRIVVKSIYDFRMQSLHSAHQLRMKIISSSDQQATSSASADDWIRIISVVSQSGQSTASGGSSNHKPRRLSIHTNGLVNGDPIQGGPVQGGDYSNSKTDLVNGRKISRTASNSEDGSIKRASCNGFSKTQKSHSDKGSRCNQSNGDEHKMTGPDQWNDWPGSRLVSPDNISEDNDAIDVYDNEIYYINYVQDQNPEISSTNMISPCNSSDEDVGHKTPIDKTINEFPEMPEKHPRFLQVLYSAPVESALETESGGRINEQNDEITSASKRKSVVCSFCRKTLKNQLALNRHVISTHIHDKRRAIKDHREQKSVDKSFVCEICHSSFKTSNMLKKHMKSHNRMICEVCKAEYLNKMDFDWHRAQCTGENRSSCTIPGAWTRARSRQSRIPKDVERIVEMTHPILDVKIQTTTVMHFEIQSTPANVTTTNAITSSRLSEINKDEQLEKWVEESKKLIELDQLEHVPQTVRPKRARRSRKRKKSTPRKQTRKRAAVSDHESEIEDITREAPPLNCSFRASTPFPTRRMSCVSSTGSFLSNRPLSQASHNTSQTNLDSWAQHFSDFDDNYDDNASVYSNFTEISTSGQSDITARTGISQSSNRSRISRISRTQSRPVSQCSVRTVESITSSITRLSAKPKTRNVANQLKKLEQELNNSRSFTEQTHNPGRNRRFRRHPYFERKGKPVPLTCTEIECHGQQAFASQDDLMDHQFQVHRMLRLFRCSECRTRFTQKDFLKEHKKTHAPGPYMCTLCDENLETESKLRLHFDLHRMKSMPCDYDCDKIFLREIDKLHHNIKYHSREMSQDEEDKFVADFLRKRAKKGGPATIGGSLVRPLKRMTIRNSYRNSVDLKLQSEYAKILEAMHSSDVSKRLSPVPGCSHEHDTTETKKIQTRKRSTQDKSDIEDVELGLGVCDTIMNSDSEECKASTLKPPEFKLTHSDHDMTETEYEHVSTRSSVLNDIIREPKISLTARRKSRHVMTFEPLDNDLASFKLFCYADLIKNEIKINGELGDITTLRAKPWRF